MTRVYKILDAQVWAQASATGHFDGAGVDLQDGYIHLSTAAQAADTARLHFAGRAGLVLLELQAEDLDDGLRWEPSRGGQLFPHLYGPLDTRLVRASRPLELNAQGWPDPGPLSA